MENESGFLIWCLVNRVEALENPIPLSPPPTPLVAKQWCCDAGGCCWVQLQNGDLFDCILNLMLVFWWFLECNADFEGSARSAFVWACICFQVMYQNISFSVIFSNLYIFTIRINGHREEFELCLTILYQSNNHSVRRRLLLFKNSSTFIKQKNNTHEKEFQFFFN